MRRIFNGDRTPNVKPVQKIELSDKNIKARLIIVIVAVLVAAASIAFGIRSCVAAEKGWQVIEAETAKTSCASEFTFIYNVGNNGGDPTVEMRAVKSIYGSAAINAYQFFDTNADGGELEKINKNAGTDVEIEHALYTALETMIEKGGRTLYFAPYQERYDVLFGSDNDGEAAAFDPEKNADTAALFEKLAAFINDPAAVSLSLKGNDTVCLTVSDEYKAFADDNGVDSFIGFTWLKNAFIADYIADYFAETGYSSGYVVSREGFYRDLGAAGKSSTSIYLRSGGAYYVACRVDNSVIKSGALFCDFPRDEGTGFIYENGNTVMPYIDADGAYKHAVPTMYVYSKSATCAETALAAGKVYIADALDKSAITSLKDGGIETVYIDGGTIYYTDADVVIANILTANGVSLTKKYVE